MTERDPGRDVEPFAVRPARRQWRSHAPDQFCDISGLLVELSEPCNSTHVFTKPVSDAVSFSLANVVSQW